MNTDKLFIEYIVIGSLSITWVIPILLILDKDGSLLTNVDITDVLLAIPIAYAIGMIIDFMTAKLFRKVKNEISQTVFTAFNLPKHEYYEVIVKLAFYNSDLLKQLVMRTNRVRVARGTFLNISLACILFPIFLFLKKEFIGGVISIVVLLSIAILTWHMWKKTMLKSYEYQCYAIREIESQKLILNQS